MLVVCLKCVKPYGCLKMDNEKLLLKFICCVKIEWSGINSDPLTTYRFQTVSKETNFRDRKEKTTKINRRQRKFIDTSKFR